jgi:hypothetical protein
MASSIAGRTIGLALSHAFEAAYVAQTIIRPITSALQTGFTKVAQISNGSAGNSGEPAGWVKAMDVGPTDPEAQQSRSRQRTAGTGTERHTRYINHAIACPEYDPDESRNSTLWKLQRHDGDEQSNQ